MGNCIHYKNGKYRLWSSYSDEFVTDWVDKKTVISILKDEALQDFAFNVTRRLRRAEDNGCSLIPDLIRHKDEEI